MPKEEEIQEGAPTGDAPGNKSGEVVIAPEKKFTQEDIDKIVKERLERERKKAEESATKAAEELKAKTLAEQGEFQKLSESQKAKLAELALEKATLDDSFLKVAADRDRFQAALNAHVAERMKGIPAHITTLLEALDPIAQMDWLTKNASKLGVGATPTGIDPTPKTKTQGDTAADEQAKLSMQRQYKGF